MKITLAQLNPTVGDISGNLRQMIETVQNVYLENPDLIVFPELFLCGYPPKDLLERSAFIRELQAAIDKLIELTHNYSNCGILFGVPTPTEKKIGKGLYNSAMLIQKGKIVATVHKSLLPTYDVFDEARYFDPAPDVQPIPFKDQLLGISICEDAWNDPELWYRPIYTFDPITRLVEKGATLLINISASPFSLGKDEIRHRLAANHAIRHQRDFILVNTTGGNDELVFDGNSIVMNRNGKLIESLPSFITSCKTIDFSHTVAAKEFHPMEKIPSVHDALVLGLQDYVKKTGFEKVIVGLSGGIDSALTCAIAVRALGRERVWGVTMPSQYSSRGSIADAKTLAANLGIRLMNIPIQPIFTSYLHELESCFAGRETDITEENIQARIRGNLLMALSNKFGYLVLSTGNKSEMAMGYCTLYGDMTGGLSVISDVPKTMVYEIARYINREQEIIPQEILTKAPSAELKENQKDEDSLPPYRILDPILDYYLNKGLTASEIVDLGYEREIVYQVVGMVDRSEYKRRQSAPGLKVTSKAFGSGRRMPIAAKCSQSWG